MQIGMVGLGRMGANMAKRLMRGGHDVVVNDLSDKAVGELINEGASGSTSLEEFLGKLQKPRTVWLMVPAGAVDSMIAKIVPHLEADDILIDGGNSYYIDDIRRSKELEPKGIKYIDVGTSGGVWGLERGYCMMIGGPDKEVQYLDPIFATLAPGMGDVPRTKGRADHPSTAEQGYLHCGATGGGHFVKMVHNGIEYGLMAAYAEGFNVLKNANIGKQAEQEHSAELTPLRDPDHYKYDFELENVAEVWRRGSVIASWLLDLTAAALLDKPDLGTYGGRVSDSGEGRWTIIAAIDEGVPVDVLSASLFSRFSSRGNGEFANKILSAMRFGFGGHLEETVKAGK
jgi:6-phosphogluconate dehydrogenase